MVEIPPLEPQPQNHAARLALARKLVSRLEELYPGQLLAVGLYGSTARGIDGPYSDVEMWCVVDVPELETDIEWVYGHGKAEINVFGRETVMREAGNVDDHWSISRGAILNARLLYGDTRILEDMIAQVRSASDEAIRRVIKRVLVEELYEFLGKALNARESGKFSGLPGLAVKFIETSALLVGLGQRWVYTTGMSMLEESLTIPDLPEGYAQLCQRVIQGNLTQPEQIIQEVQAAWSGMVAWATRHGAAPQVADFPPVEQPPG